MTLPPTFVQGFHDEKAVSKMEYRSFGKTDMTVSKLAIGGATLSNLFGQVDEDEAIATLQQAVKKGINYIDTAPFYGQGESETIVGKALKGIPRKAYYIATKIGRYTRDFDTMFDYSAKKTRESVEKSLKLLGVDYIDVLQIHDIEFVPTLDAIINEALPEIEKLVKEGKVRYIGVSAYPIDVLKKAITLAPGRFNTVLCYARYTMLDDTLKEYLQFFKEQNLAIICASVHAIGLLSNHGPQPWHPASDEVKALCRQAVDICKKDGIELGKLAMYYAAQLEGPSIFLVGMQTRRLLEINLEAVVNGLTPKEQDVLKLLTEKYFTKTGNWEGVEISAYRKHFESKKKVIALVKEMAKTFTFGNITVKP